METVSQAATVLDEGEASANYEGTVELDILPPLSPAQLVEIQSYLRRWPGIGISELRPSNNGCLISLILDRPIQLIHILKQLPEVEDARECDPGDDGTVDTAPGRGRLKRIEITVCGTT